MAENFADLLCRSGWIEETHPAQTLKVRVSTLLPLASRVRVSDLICVISRVDYLSQKLSVAKEADKQSLREQIVSLEDEIDKLR